MTVLMAAYNGETHIREAITSVLKQTFQSFKLLIVDDASTDGTADVISAFKDPRITCIRNEHNLGLAASLNRGLEDIDTEFVARMDCDDTCHPQRLAWQVAFMDEHPELGLSGTWLRTFGLPGQRGLSRYPVSAEAVRVSQLFGSPVAHATLIMRKAMLDEHALRYDPAFTRTEDFDFVTRATDCFPVSNLPRCTYFYRRHQDCATIIGEDTMIAEVGALILRQMVSLDLNPSPRELELHCRACIGRGFSSHEDIWVADGWFEQLRLRLRDRRYADPDTIDHVLGRYWNMLCRNSTRLGFDAMKACRRPCYAGHYKAPFKERVLFWGGVGRHLLQRSSIVKAPLSHGADGPLVSVLMPMRDAATYLSEAVASIVGQTYQNLEFLVVDDASQDDSISVVESFNDPRIRILRNEEGLGVAGALNRALEHARGKYIARMDADDISLPSRIETQVRFLEEHNSVAVLGSRVSYIGGPLGMVDLRPVYPAAASAYLIFGTPVAHPTVMIRRDSLERDSLRYRSEFSRTEDFDLWTRLAEHGQLSNVPDQLLRYRLHPQSVSSLHSDVMSQQEQEIIRRQLNTRGVELSEDEFAMFRCVARGERLASLDELEVARRLLLRIVADDDVSPAAMQYAASVAWLRLCCNCGPLGFTVWRRYLESGLVVSVPGAWLAKKEMLASCIWYACTQRFRS